ncbi:MAG: nicotinate-nucleotide adenylyltransferase [Lachnospiraceae bacterium]
MGKIGLMGGTFNPIHNGHLQLAKAAYEQMELEAVWFIPNGISYLKKDIDVLSPDVRAQMVKLAIKDIPQFSFSDIELKRKGNTYTVDTLRDLKRTYPQHQFYFIMGADSLAFFHKWKDADEIVKYCTILVAARDKILGPVLQECREMLEKKLNAVIQILDFELVEIASSDIRACLQKNKCLANELPPLVEAFIREHQLYQ